MTAELVQLHQQHGDVVTGKLEACRELVATATAQQAVELISMAGAMATYARRKQLGQEIIGLARALEVEAMRRLGEILKEAPKNTGAKGIGSAVPSAHRTPTLAEMGLDKRTSSLAQKVAALSLAEVEQVKANPNSTERAVREVEKAKRKAEVRETGNHATNRTSDLSVLSAKGMKFGAIYADPPWVYGNQSTRGATEDHYVGLSVDEICALPVKELATDSAHLHLWTTNAFLFDAKRVMEAWGFEYRSCYIWVKPQMGMGNYWRVSHEFMLLGVRSKSKPFNDNGMKSWGEFSRGQHSAKPEVIRQLIERASDGPYLELFARRPAPGWTVWGNEVDDRMNESQELVA